MKYKNRSFSVAGRVRSIRHAFVGLLDMLATEPNAWVHALATVVALDLAWWFGVTREEFALIVIAIVSVWVAEAFNTVLEIMADLVVGERNSRIVKRAKDIAAAAVLIAAIGAVIIAVIVFKPYFVMKISGN